MLVRAEDDAARLSSELQDDLRQIVTGLQAAGVSLWPRLSFRDAAGAAAGMAGALVVVAKTLGHSAVPVLVAWLHGRYGRKVRLRIGATEIEARSPEEVEKLLAMARNYAQGDEHKRVSHE